MSDADPTSPAIDGVETLHDGWGRFLMVTLVTPQGERLKREVEDHGPSVVVLPYDPARRVVLLVRQPRTPLILLGAESVLEAPAGRIEGEDAEAAARREAMEECGVRLTVLEPAGTYFAMPGVSTEHLTMFLAPYTLADRIGPGGGLAEEGEEIEVIEMPFDTLFALAAAHRLHDLKTALLVAVLRERVDG